MGAAVLCQPDRSRIDALVEGKENLTTDGQVCGLTSSFLLKAVFSLVWGCRGKFFARVRFINSAGQEGAMDFLSKSLPGFAQLLEAFGSDAGDDLADLQGQARVQLFQGRPA